MHVDPSELDGREAEVELLSRAETIVCLPYGGVVVDDELVALSTEFGLTWVELDAYRAADGSFESALIVSEDPTAQISGLEGVVPVDSLDIVDPVIQPVWRGEPLGGLTLKDCE